jgi:glutamate/tyrosine decarboxylase-like PLP-dependent enzyme
MNSANAPVNAKADAETLRKRLGRQLPEQGSSPETVIRELVEDVNGGIIGSTGGRFFGWVIGGSLPAALAADWLTSAWDQNSTLYATSPASAIVEEIAGGWLKEMLGLPSVASFALVTGCQMAHFTCLAAARHALLGRSGWNVEEKGLYGAPPIRILTTAMRHGTAARALRFLGLGDSHVEYIPTDSEDAIRIDELEKSLARQSGPIILILQAGDINIGAFDSFETAIPLAKRYGAWVHVDGAFGLWAGASTKYRHLVAGVGEADSWATDGHKWLNVPFDCGYAFVARSEAHRAAMSHRAAYLTHADEARDELDWTPEWSRRARGFATYAAIRQLGRRGVAELIERCCEHAHTFVTGIGTLPGAEILWEPRINQGLVRFLDERLDASDAHHDQRTDEVVARINSSGEAFFSGTTWRGRRAMRISVCNWRTSKEDVERTVRAVAEAMKQSSNSESS